MSTGGYGISRWRWPRVRLPACVRDDAGQTLLIVAGVLMVAALSAAALFLSLDSGKRIVSRLKSGNVSQAQALPAVISYYLQHANGGATTLPCPSAIVSNLPTGTADTTCDGSASHPNAGPIPWVTLGMSRDQAIDAYGNFYTYVVSADTQQNQVCKTVTNSYNSATQATGSIASPAANSTKALEDRLSSITVGKGSQVPFVIIGHGPNGTGARKAASGNFTTAPTTGSAEYANCDPASCTSQPLLTSVVTGPFTGSQANGTQPTIPFDDQVFVPTAATLQKMCESLTPGGALNANLTDTFGALGSSATQLGTTGLDASKYSSDTTNVKTTTDVTNSGNQVADFAAGGGLLATNTLNYSFDPRIHPLYVSALWTPAPNYNSAQAPGAGMSIVTRATATDESDISESFPLTTILTNDFNSGGKHGITFQFFGTNAGNADTNANINTVANHGGANYIAIRNDGAPLAVSVSTYNLYFGKSYLIEAYDDGGNVWARITQTDDNTNTAIVGPFATSVDLDGLNQVLFVSGVANANSVPSTLNTENYIDDLTVGLGMLALETDGVQGYATSSPTVPTVNGGSVTVEAWIRPRALPASGKSFAILGAYDPADATAADNSFLLSMVGSTQTTAQLSLSLSGSSADTKPHVVPFTPTLNQWVHVAAVYDKVAATASFYVNGELTGDTSTSSLSSSTGINTTGTHPFVVGAATCASCSATPSLQFDDFFPGDISDVRVWAGARTGTNILADYNTRVSYTTGYQDAAGTQGTPVPLYLNWKLDNDPLNGISIASATATPAAISSGGSTSPAAPTGSFLPAPIALTPAYAAYIGTLANYFRPSADTVCPAGTIAGVYECDFRSVNASGAQDYSTGASGPTIPVNLEGVHVRLWAAGGGSFNVTAGGGGGFSAASIYAIGGVAVAGNTLNVVTGDGGTGSTATLYPASGAGGGGASMVAMTAGTLTTPAVGLAAGGGGGASDSGTKVTIGSMTLDCTNSGAFLTPNRCGLGAGGGGYGASPVQAPDDLFTTCGGLPGTTTPTTLFGSNPTSTLCDFGGQAPTKGTGGGGTAAMSNNGAAGGASQFTIAGTNYNVSAGGAGTIASSVQGGVGGGGGGGGVNTVDASYNVLTGGAGAGGFGAISIDTVKIAGTPTAGPVTLTFGPNNTTVTATLGSGDVAGTTAANLITAAMKLGAAINGVTGLGIAVPTVTTSTLTLIEEGLSLMSAIGTPERISPPVATMSGGTGLTCMPALAFAPATATLMLSGSLQPGDTVAITIGSTAYTYTVGVSDVNIATLASNIASDISTNPLFGLAALGYTASSPSSGAIQISYGLLGAGCLGNGVVISSTVNGMTVSVTPSLPGFTASEINGYGGGGGAGFANTVTANNVLNPVGAAAPISLLGTPANSGATATVTMTAATLSGQVDITIKGHYLVGATPTFFSASANYNATAGDSAATVASALANAIGGNSTLQTALVSATATGGILTISQQGYIGNGLTLDGDGSDAGLTMTFSPTDGQLGNHNGRLGGYDIYYSPTYVPAAAQNPGNGGVIGANGSAGAAVILW